MIELALGDLIQTRKKHPCGADIKIKCKGCGRIVMLERPEFEKRMKKHLGKDAPEEG